MDALSLSFHKERAKERKLKGLMPLRNPQDLSLSLSFGGYQKACWRLRVLRRRSQSPASYCKQAISPRFTPHRATRTKTRKTQEFMLQLSPYIYHARRAEEEKVFSFSVGAGASTAHFGGRHRKQNRFCLKYSWTRVRSSWQKLLLFCSRASFVFASFFNLQTQKLKMLAFAKK